MVHPPSETHLVTARQKSAREIRKLLVLAFAIAVLLLVAWFVRHALLIIYVSTVFAVVLKPAVDWLHKTAIFGWRPGRGSALLLIVLLLCLFFGGMLAIALPSIIGDVTAVAKTMSRQSGGLERLLRSVPLLRNVSIAKLGGDLSTAAGKMLPDVGAAAMDVITGLLLVAYLVLDGSTLLNHAMLLVPPQRRARLQGTLDRAAGRMRRWITGQAMLMAILGGSAAVTFGIMGLPYFYLLALFAGVANIVPLLGPLATVIVASLVAVTQSWWHVLGVIIFYLVYQQVENAFLTPNIMKAQVQLSSPMVIIALLVGSELAGIPGALVAVPSAVLLAEIVQEYLIYEPAADPAATD